MGSQLRARVVMGSLINTTSFLFLLTLFPTGGFSECPCVKKVTESLVQSLEGTYVLLEESDPGDPVCFDQCIYLKEGSSKDDQYCFKEVGEGEGAEVVDEEQCPVTGAPTPTSLSLQQRQEILAQQQTDLNNQMAASETFSDNIDGVETVLEDLTSSDRRKREEGGKSRKKRALSVPTDCATVLLYAEKIQLTSSSTAADMVTASEYVALLAQVDVPAIKASSPCSEAELTQLTEQKDSIAATKASLETVSDAVKREVNELISTISALNSLLAEEGLPTQAVELVTYQVPTIPLEPQQQTIFTTTPAPNK